MRTDYSLLVAIWLFNLAMSVLLFSYAMVVAASLRRRTDYLMKYSSSALVLLALFGAARVFLPFDFPFNYGINSFVIVPKILSVLYADIWPGAGRIELQTAVLAVWGIGSLVMLFRMARYILKERSYRKRYRISDNAQACRVARELRLNRVKIIVSQDVVMPYITGFFRAIIYLPRIEISDGALELVLKHEYRHFKSGDAFIKAFYILLSILFWWNPIVHTFMRELDHLLELRCDEAIIKRMSEDEKTSYLESLLLVAKHILTKDTAKPAGVSAFLQAEQRGFMEQRFHIILNKQNMKFDIKQIVSIVLVVMVSIVSFLFVIQPAYNPPAEDMEGVYELTPKNAYLLITQDGGYRLYVDGRFVFEFDEAEVEKDIYKDLPIIKAD